MRVKSEVRRGKTVTRKGRCSDRLTAAQQSKRVRLEKDFPGVAAGEMRYVGTPRIVDRYIRSIPRGESRTVVRLRNELARRNRCDAMCPVSTAIFVRICAEAAWEQVQSGAPTSEVAPFWRVVEPGSPIAKRLSADSRWIAHQRELEGIR